MAITRTTAFTAAEPEFRRIFKLFKLFSQKLFTNVKPKRNFEMVIVVQQAVLNKAAENTLEQFNKMGDQYTTELFSLSTNSCSLNILIVKLRGKSLIRQS